MPDASTLYNDKFYENSQNSYRSAKKYAELLFKLFSPISVVDIGCGRGAWLKAFKDYGSKKCVGVDGNWNKQEYMIDQSLIFQSQDLNQPIKLDCQFDLAICVEVAEHLTPKSSFDFINSLSSISDVVIFGAAFIRQGGTHHINEEYHTYWEDLFSCCGYVVFDYFRPLVWNDEDDNNNIIDWWYQQNTFLYIKKDSNRYTEFIAAGIRPLINKRFMNAIHPWLYAQKKD